MSRNNTKRLLFLRKGVRFSMKYIADDNIKVFPNEKPTVAGLVMSIAEGKWFRPDLTDVAFRSLDDKGDGKYSQVSVSSDTYGKLCKVAVNIGFNTIEDLLEDFSTGIWEVIEE